MTTLISSLLPNSTPVQPPSDPSSGIDDGSFSGELDRAKSKSDDSTSVKDSNGGDATASAKPSDGPPADASATDASDPESTDASAQTVPNPQQALAANATNAKAPAGKNRSGASNSDDRSGASAAANSGKSSGKSKTSNNKPALEDSTQDDPTPDNSATGKASTGKTKPTQTPVPDPTALQTFLAQASGNNPGAVPQPVANTADAQAATTDGAAGAKVNAVKAEQDLAADSPLEPGTQAKVASLKAVYGNADAADDPADTDEEGATLDDALAATAGTHAAGKSDETHGLTDQLQFDMAPTGPTGPPHLTHTNATPLPVAQTPDTHFSEANHPAIVSTIRGNLIPNGGTMSIRLDPPELGAMQVTVKIEGGVVSASFETSNEQATRLLTHTLSQLKTALEGQGVTVDRLHVHQSSKPDSGSSSGDGDNNGKQTASDQRSAQQEQQRKEMLRRMWQRVSGDKDPLDMVA